MSSLDMDGDNSGSFSVEVGARLQCLEKLYEVVTKGGLSELINHNKTDNLTKLSDEIRGGLVVQRIEKAADTLNVCEFVTGRVSIPVVPELKEYVRAHRIQLGTNSRLQSAKESLDERTRDIESVISQKEELQSELKEAKESGRRRPFSSSGTTSTLKSESSSAEERDDYSHRSSREIQTELSRCIDQLDRLRDRLDRDMDLIAKKEEDAVKEAKQQHRDDVRAVANLNAALAAVMVYTRQLLEKAGKNIELNARKRNADDSEDPVEAGNIKRVFENLKERYQKGDELSIACATVNIMHLITNSADMSMAVVIKKIDDYRFSMEQVGTSGFPIGAFCGYVAVATMKESDRLAFLQRERMIGMLDSRSSTTGSTVESESTLLDRVRKFAEDKEEESSRSKKLGAKGIDEVKPSNQKEQQVLVTVETKSGQQAQCRAFARDGFCSRSNCQYVHSKPKAQDSSEQKPKGACRKWQEDKKCEYGDKCRFTHDVVSATKTTTSSNPKESDKKKTIEKKTAFAVATKSASQSSAFESASSGSDEEGGNSFVIVTEKTSTKQDNSIVLVTRSSDEDDINWDTAADTNAGPPSIESRLDNVRMTRKSVTGVGGSVQVKCIGDIPEEKMFDVSIINGKIPIIKSVSKMVQSDGHGGRKIMIITAKGAVLLDHTPSLLNKIKTAMEDVPVVSEAEWKRGVLVQKMKLDHLYRAVMTKKEE